MKDYNEIKQRIKSTTTFSKTSQQILHFHFPSAPCLLLDNHGQTQTAGLCPAYVVLLPSLIKVLEQDHKIGPKKGTLVLCTAPQLAEVTRKLLQDHAGFASDNEKRGESPG